MGEESYEEIAPSEDLDSTNQEEFELDDDSAIQDELHTSLNNQTITVDDAIERIGFGRFQLYILFAAGLCFASDAMQVMLLSFLSEVLKVEWGLTDDETASITSMLFFGAIFGTLILGPLADRRGRKPVFLIAATIISFFGISVAFVSNYWSLLALLFFVGFGVGGLTVPVRFKSQCIYCEVLANLLPFIIAHHLVVFFFVSSISCPRFCRQLRGGRIFLS